MAVVDIVTGASQGIGGAVAESIAVQRSFQFEENDGDQDYLLVLVGRNVQRGTATADRVRKAAGGSLPVCFESCDVSDFGEVQSLEERISDKMKSDKFQSSFRVGILVNAAAECPRQQQFVQRKQESEGSDSCSIVQLDRQFSTNVLGYHFMMKVFQKHFPENGPKTHVVNIASNWAGNLDLNDLQFTRRSYDNDTAYRQSKQCNRMLTKVWSEKLEGRAVVNSCHPGDPRTTLSVALGYNTWSSPPTWSMIENETPIPYLCGFDIDQGGSRKAGGKKKRKDRDHTSDDLETENEMVTGAWFQGRSGVPSHCQFSLMTAEADRLFEICNSFCYN